MWAGALYYPFMRIRDTNWLKIAALYWDSMYRFQPRGYHLRETRESQEFLEAGFLRRVEPRPYAGAVAADLHSFLLENMEAMRFRFSVDDSVIGTAAGPRWGNEGPAGERAGLGWIHISKMAMSFAGVLAESGLARIGHGSNASWVGLHPTVAAAYMLALTGECAVENQLEPVTDISSRRLSPTWGVDGAMRLLTDDTVGHDVRDRGDDAAARFAMLAIESVVPRDLSAISVERIMAVRTKLAEELASFREFVEAQRPELERLSTIRSSNVHADAWAAHLNTEVMKRVDRLDRGLRRLGFDTIRSLLTVRTVTPPVLLAVGANYADVSPAVAVAGTVGILVGTAWWQLGKDRERELRQSPVGYLLATRRALRARTITERTAGLLHR